MDIERNVQKASEDIQLVLTAGEFELQPTVQRAEVPRATWADFRRYFSRWENGKVLFGTAYSWFAIDVGSFILFAFQIQLINVVGCFLWTWPQYLSYLASHRFRQDREYRYPGCLR